VFEHDLGVPVDDACVRQRAEVSGVHTRKFARTMQGTGRVFGLKFQPGGLFPFFGASISMLTDQVVPAGQVFHHDVYGLASQLRTRDTPAEMAAAASAYLASHLPERDPDSETAANLVKTVLEDSTIQTVEALCDISNLSTRALQRLFRMYVGVSPKWVIRRYRIHELLERLNSGAAFNGAELALELGYADQSHLINDFTKLVGLSPGRYLERVQNGAYNVRS
jgi:AraC-like DNA-binding protein